MTHPVIPITSTALRNAPLPVGWRCWPLGEGSGQVWLFVAAAALVGGVVGAGSGSGGWAAAAVVLLAASAWRLFVPVVFELSALGISQQILAWRRRVSWTSVERVEIGREGVFLSLEAAPLAALRGLYVPWGPHREEVLAQISYYVPGNRVVGDRVEDTLSHSDSAIARRLSELEAPALGGLAPRSETGNPPHQH